MQLAVWTLHVRDHKLREAIAPPFGVLDVAAKPVRRTQLQAETNCDCCCVVRGTCQPKVD